MLIRSSAAVKPMPIESPSRMSHFPLTGTTGFDLYSDEDGRSVYIGTFVPPYDIGTSYESLVKFGGEKMREITIHMPLYANVTELYIGIDENATLKASTPYEHERPAVFYGSSVTQGGCASRPGNSYEAVLSRELSLDHVNLGFSGGAKAEDEMIEYLASYLKEINASLFVLDYDYNSPSKEHLEATHEKAFKRIREVNRSLPILILSRPKYRLSYDERLRREIIRRTYENAVNSGDKNVYFIDGVDLMELCREDGTVDNCHPTDFGFASMAAKIKPLLASIIDN